MNRFLLSTTSRFAVILSFFLLTYHLLDASEAQKKYEGYKLIEKRFVKEVNAECMYFEHIKSGAKVFKILSEDPNKTFMIGFVTNPESDNGAPHILEHSLLNGSKNYPVKSPYDILAKGSLNTMLNAFTSKDMTRFPIASMNDKDYFNLMHVCLDAMFNPLFLENPKTLKQEGWHYELTDKDSPLIYKGVVYNEMKGAFSNPGRELIYQVFRNLFPGNGYGFESGGYPSSIPTLTQENFIRYYKKYYHPGNSYVFFYGNADLSKELGMLDSLYLSKYTRHVSGIAWSDQPSISSMKKVAAGYSVSEGAKTSDQTYLTMNYITGRSTDQVLSMALDIIAEALLNQESSPLRLALQKAGTGKDFSASVFNFRQNMFQIKAINANPGDQEKFHNTIDSTLREVIKNGYDQKTVKGILNRIEFQLREGNDAQKGMSYGNACMTGWMYKGDPFTGLEYEKPLAELKQKLASGYLESISRQYLLENPNSLLLSLEPKPGLDKEKNEKVVAKLQDYKSKLGDKQIEALISETKDLIAYQKREDTPEALATIPLLALKDINPKAASYNLNQQDVNGIKLLTYREFTNNVVYLTLHFNLLTIPQELLPYASLLTTYLSNLDTKTYSYGDLNKELNINTGGFYTGISTFFENDSDDKMIPKFTVTSKAMNNQLEKTFSLNSEILINTIYSDTSRLREILDRLNAQLEVSMKSNGFGIARNRLPSYCTKAGVFNELVSGLDYSRFIHDLSTNFGSKSGEIRANLEKVAKLLFTRGNFIAAATADTKDFEKVSAGLKTFLSGIPVGNAAENTWNLQPVKKLEGFLAPSKVQYVIEGYDYKKLGYTYSGKMRVLSQILSSDWLQQQIRVIGGAYGGFSLISSRGMFTFNSYRDPNLKETLDNYAATVNYLNNFSADDRAMTRYIIGTISSLDAPLAPSGKGDQAFSRWFSKKKQEDVQRERDEVLASKPEDIRGFADLVKAVVDQKTYCVYGNAEKLTDSKQLFSDLVKID